MPHLILEYSSNIKEKPEFRSLFSRLHEVLIKIAQATPESCKSRTVEYKIFYIGNGESSNAFVHLGIRLAEGRTLAIQEKVGKQALQILSEYFTKSLEDLNLQITVELNEFSRKLYFKIPEGPV